VERIYFSIAALILAYLLDCLIGDPPGLPHPVRFLGRVITGLEKMARRLFKTPAGLKTAGALIVIIAAGGSLLATVVIIEGAYLIHDLVGFSFETYILFTVLAGGDLRKHVDRVNMSLKAGRLDRARSGVAMLVSRDTEELNESGVSRASLESLFENSADGLVAPLFFIAIGGAPLAVFYKAVNTLDSMLGYLNDAYRDLGYFPAKADDILSFIPSRLTAILLVLAGGFEKTASRGLTILLSDHGKHSSPNSAWPEAAAAGVLGLKFGGPDYYQGRLKKQPLINAFGKDARPDDISRGLKLFGRVSIIACGCSVAVYYFLLSRGVYIF